MVGGRFTGQLRYWRQHTGQIAGQEGNALRLAGAVFNDALVDVLERVGGASVLGFGNVGVVGQTGLRIDHHVFQYRAELDRVPDYRLVLLRQVDALGVAAAFDVEHHTFAPTVLVVTNQVTGRIGGQGGFARAGQTEEQYYVTVVADVGRAMHRQHVRFRQQEVLHREHGFFHFTGVLHASNQHATLGELENHAAVRIGAVTLRVTLEVGRVENFPVILARRVVLVRADKQGVGKQVVPGGLGGDFDRDIVSRVSADMQVRGKGVAACNKLLNARPQRIKLRCVKGAVDRAPVDLGGGAGFVNDKPVHRRTAGAVAGVTYQGAVCGQLAFVTLDGQLDELGGTQIRVRSGHIRLPGLVAGRCEFNSGYLHGGLPCWPRARWTGRATGGGDKPPRQLRRAIMPEHRQDGDARSRIGVTGPSALVGD